MVCVLSTCCTVVVCRRNVKGVQPKEISLYPSGVSQPLLTPSKGLGYVFIDGQEYERILCEPGGVDCATSYSCVGSGYSVIRVEVSCRGVPLDAWKHRT